MGVTSEQQALRLMQRIMCTCCFKFPSGAQNPTRDCLGCLSVCDTHGCSVGCYCWVISDVSRDWPALSTSLIVGGQQKLSEQMVSKAHFPELVVSIRSPGVQLRSWSTSIGHFFLWVQGLKGTVRGVATSPFRDLGGGLLLVCSRLLFHGP